MNGFLFIPIDGNGYINLYSLILYSLFVLFFLFSFPLLSFRLTCLKSFGQRNSSLLRKRGRDQPTEPTQSTTSPSYASYITRIHITMLPSRLIRSAIPLVLVRSVPIVSRPIAFPLVRTLRTVPTHRFNDEAPQIVLKPTPPPSCKNRQQAE